MADDGRGAVSTVKASAMMAAFASWRWIYECKEERMTDVACRASLSRRRDSASSAGLSDLLFRRLRHGHIFSFGGMIRRVAVGLTLALICLVSGFASSSAQAGTTYVDGISDQSIPNWDSGFSGSYFAGFFQN